MSQRGAERSDEQLTKQSMGTCLGMGIPTHFIFGSRDTIPVRETVVKFGTKHGERIRDPLGERIEV